MFFDETEVSVEDADDPDAIFVNGGFGDGADDGVESGAIASAGENSEGFNLFLFSIEFWFLVECCLHKCLISQGFFIKLR